MNWISILWPLGFLIVVPVLIIFTITLWVIVERKLSLKERKLDLKEKELDLKLKLAIFDILKTPHHELLLEWRDTKTKKIVQPNMFKAIYKSVTSSI